MSGYLIFHPKREVGIFDNISVYYDSGGCDKCKNTNQDPYIWNPRFLHTYCHITQMKKEEGHINFWVSSDKVKGYTHLYCDLVFFVEKKCVWNQPNFIDRSNPIVESDEAYIDHYQWAKYEHHLKKKRRITLKAFTDKSFQPQTTKKELIDILPFLKKMGLPFDTIRKKGALPHFIDDSIADALYEWIKEKAEIKLKGKKLAKIRRNHPELASLQPDDISK